jgi:hypothetical protein
MKSRVAALAVSLIAAGGCTTATDPVEVQPSGAVAEADMPAYCAEQAAGQFGVEASEVGMSVIDRSGGIYTLQGRIPPEGTARQGFQCQFDPERMFISVVPVRFRT